MAEASYEILKQEGGFTFDYYKVANVPHFSMAYDGAAAIFRNFLKTHMK